ncbi:MAG: hypothetical protein ACWGOY_10435 [Anaerolineales bacterium]
MKKKFILILALALLAALAISVISASAADDLVGLTIKNKTDKVVWVSLLSSDGQSVFWLEVAAGEEKDFTVPRDVYSHTTVACGDTATGTVDVTHLTTLIFTQCGGKPPNPGERSIEKIHIEDSPDRGDFNYQFD